MIKSRLPIPLYETAARMQVRNILSSKYLQRLTSATKIEGERVADFFKLSVMEFFKLMVMECRKL